MGRYDSDVTYRGVVPIQGKTSRTRHPKLGIDISIRLAAALAWCDRCRLIADFCGVGNGSNAENASRNHDGAKNHAMSLFYAVLSGFTQFANVVFGDCGGKGRPMQQKCSLRLPTKVKRNACIADEPIPCRFSREPPFSIIASEASALPSGPSP